MDVASSHLLGNGKQGGGNGSLCTLSFISGVHVRRKEGSVSAQCSLDVFIIILFGVFNYFTQFRYFRIKR